MISEVCGVGQDYSSSLGENQWHCHVTVPASTRMNMLTIPKNGEFIFPSDGRVLFGNAA
jgi:hypothetical protein